MIPQLAHNPRHLSQRLGESGFATPPYDHLQTSRIPDRRGPLPFRTPRDFAPSYSPASSSNPYAIESHGIQRVGLAATSENQGYGGQYHDPSEHMLRRKTPNGTLAAGYDGTPVQWSSKAPALKHVLLPMSAVSPGGQQSAGSTPRPDKHPARQRSNSLGWNYQAVPQFRGDGGLRMNSDPGNWAYPLSNPPNVLDHLSMQQATTYFPNNGMQIPTVLQPPYQPPLGPTASNDAGLYGPYWPDGMFVPYRPAAVRDNGDQLLNTNFDSNWGFQQQTNSPMELLPLFNPHSFNIDPTQQTTRQFFRTLDLNAGVHENGNVTSQQSHYMPDNTSIYSSIPDGSRTPLIQTSNKNGNSQFKEKTLSWAHSIYVDLLAFLHQSKKENRQARQGHGFKPYSKNSIYPKPPRQPTSALGNSEWSNVYNASSGSDAAKARRQSSGGLPTTHQSPSNSTFGSWQANGGFSESRFTRSSNSEVPHYISPFQAHQATTSPAGKAKEALEIITTLCEQTGWVWIDGMLLGGCLAYGLEEYNKALDWYSKILVLDPK
jgi:hypothetical protein